MTSNPKDLVGAKKAPLRFVPPALMIAASGPLEDGAIKYGPFNWRDIPVEVVTYVEAAIRHLFAFLDGQDNAEDSGLPHIDHALAGLAIIVDAKANGTLIDNRYTKGPAADMLRDRDKSKAPVVHERRIYTRVCAGCNQPWPCDPWQASIDERREDECRTGVGLKDLCSGDGLGDPSTCQVHMAPWARNKAQCDRVNDSTENAVNASAAAHAWAEDARIMHQGTLVTAEEWGAGEGHVYTHVHPSWKRR